MHNFNMETPREDKLGDGGVGGRMLLEWILEKCD
jgi:hypothetical protein